MPDKTSTQRSKLSPPQLAARWGVSSDKVLHWIRVGELRAINIALRAGGRPRWLIDLIDVELFEQRRASSSAPAAPKTRRKKANEGVIEFF